MILKNEGITDVFFDLDHTLWDFEKNSELTYKKIFSESFEILRNSNFFSIRPHYLNFLKKTKLFFQHIISLK